jgi:hypothetical protein
VFAFFSAVLFFLCLTLAFEPSDLGRIGRRWVFIPSLHVTEHMLSLATGVFAASAVIETITIGVPFNSPVKAIFAVIFASTILAGLAALCSVTAEFLSNDFDKAMNRLGSWRLVVLLVVASILIWSVFQDAVWNYKPGPLTH